jgi:small subunit ribosomal protein S8
MALNDSLSNVLSQIMTEDKLGKKAILVNCSSKVILEVLRILQEKQYIGSFEEVKSTKGSVLKINLLNNINKCGVIKPRFGLGVDDFEKFERRYLPAKGFGYLVLTTSKGIMTQDDALKIGLGGKLLAFVY